MVRREIEIDKNTDRILLTERTEAAHENKLRAMRGRAEADFSGGPNPDMERREDPKRSVKILFAAAAAEDFVEIPEASTQERSSGAGQPNDDLRSRELVRRAGPASK